MSKKRRTKAQKIIAQLKRELRREQAKPQTVSSAPKIEIVAKKEFTLKDINLKPKIQFPKEKPVNLYSYDPQLIKKDLFKTFYLSILMFIFIGCTYWYFMIK